LRGAETKLAAQFVGKSWFSDLKDIRLFVVELSI